EPARQRRADRSRLDSDIGGASRSRRSHRRNDGVGVHRYACCGGPSNADRAFAREPTAMDFGCRAAGSWSARRIDGRQGVKGYRHIVEPDRLVGDVESDDPACIGRVSGAQDLDTVVVHVDDRATEGHPQGMEVYGVEREAAGPSDLREPWAVDIPASDSVQPKLARGGIQPDLVAGAGGGIDPPADPARVVVERAETELHGQGVVAPPRLAPVRLGV